MSVMDRFARMDSTLQRKLDNGFALIFGGKVVPAEIEELLKQEALDNVSSIDDGRLIAPNVYAVGVSSKDLENLSRDQNLPQLLAEQQNRFGRNQGWDFDGPVVVRIAEETGLHTGQLRVSSYSWDAPEDDSGFDAIDHEPVTGNTGGTEQSSSGKDTMDAQHDHQPPTTVEPAIVAKGGPAQSTNQPNSDVPAARSVSLLLQDGSSRTYHVHDGSNVIGRSNDADFRLPDTGVSRQHAEITWDGSDAVLVDLQSTNGTVVNDNPIDNWLLADGDVITVGHSHIEVRIFDPSR